MKIRSPKASIWLYKPRDRLQLGNGLTAAARFRAVRQIDITSHLADAGFRTQRTIGDPNGGSFQIVFDDKPVMINGNFGDSLYGLIEPMDFIEIRATGLVDKTPYPLIMRGFVKNIGEDESIEGGTPQRRIVVTGVDVAHALQLLRVRYSAFGVLPDTAAALTEKFGIPFGEPALAAFQTLTDWTGSVGNPLAPTELVDAVIKTLVNPYLAKLFENTPALAALSTMTSECSIVDGMAPAIQGSGAFDGRSVYEVLSQMLDVGPFNELYVDDRDTELKLVARPLPWIGADGSAIGGATPATDYPLDASSYMGGSMTRSDAGVANYYWVNRQQSLLNDATLRLVGASGSPETYLLTDYENANPTAFGWRFMQVDTTLTYQGAAIVAPTDAQVAPRSLSEEDWLAARRQTLINLNRDNLVFESGSIRLKGDAGIKPGTYLLLPRGRSSVRMYADSVAHEFSQNNGFTTTVSVSRGTGWLDRAASGGMPYYEWRDERGVT